MSKDWKKFDSPYDPNHQGKMQKPKTAEEAAKRIAEAEGNIADATRLHASGLFNCGNSGCPECNPRTVRFTNPGRDPFSDRDMLRRYYEQLFDRGVFFEARPAQPANQPPTSYTDARKKVEKYIHSVPDQSFDDIIGNEEALAQLKDAIEAPIKFKELYEAYGMKMPKGALLSGPPGCGKTMFARAAAAEMNRLYGNKKKGFEFLSLSGSELQSKWIGETEKEIKALFTFAREYKAYHGYPLLIFMDECEVILPDRTGRVRGVMPWEESQVATFIAEMDGMQETGAFMLLATNRPEVIDQAVLRDGRVDFKITIKRPTPEAVEEIIRKNFVGVLVKDDMAQLVFAAVESLHDPHKVILDHHLAVMDVENRQFRDVHQKHFLLEHIVSGAMAAAIPTRAKRYAFARDKLTGKALGVTVGDVVRVVNDLFEENKKLEHQFALEEFREEFMREAHDKKELK